VQAVTITKTYTKSSGEPSTTDMVNLEPNW